MISDTKNNQNFENENQELLEEENINDIKTEFIDSKENKDFISSKGHKINPDLNEYTTLNGSLNNITNPFIYEQENIKNKEKSINNNNITAKDTYIKEEKFYDNSIVLKQNNLIKENNKEYSNNIEKKDNNLINKFNDKPPYSYNEENAKEIDNKWIITKIEDKITEYSKKDKDNYWYKKLLFFFILNLIIFFL